jgi:hypothetical protein
MAISASPQPPPQKKKSGWGCCGCGCAFVVVVLLLLAGLAGGGMYVAYKAVYGVSAATASSVPTFTGSDDVYAGAQKKLDAFNQDVSAGRTSTLTLSNDELNALIAHNPDLTRKNVHLYATMTGDQMRLQGSVPANAVPLLAPFYKDRYFNFDGTFALALNPETKQLRTTTRAMTLGDKQLPENELPLVDVELQPWLTIGLEASPSAKAAVQAAQSISVHDGNFVVTTK